MRTGKLHCIATGTLQRTAQLPDVPTVAEQGYKAFEMSQWYGLNVPASMPAAAIERLAQAAAKAMKEPATLERLAHDAAIAVGGTPGDYAAFIAAEQKRWQPVIARAKIKSDFGAQAPRPLPGPAARTGSPPPGCRTAGRAGGLR